MVDRNPMYTSGSSMDQPLLKMDRSELVAMVRGRPWATNLKRIDFQFYYADRDGSLETTPLTSTHRAFPREAKWHRTATVWDRRNQVPAEWRCAPTHRRPRWGNRSTCRRVPAGSWCRSPRRALPRSSHRRRPTWRAAQESSGPPSPRTEWRRETSALRRRTLQPPTIGPTFPPFAPQSTQKM